MADVAPLTGEMGFAVPVPRADGETVSAGLVDETLLLVITGAGEVGFELGGSPVMLLAVETLGGANPVFPAGKVGATGLLLAFTVGEAEVLAPPKKDPDN